MYDSLVAALGQNEYLSKPRILDLDKKHRESPPARPSIVEALKLELKVLPPNLRYVFLGTDDTFSVIIVSESNGKQVDCLVASAEEVQVSHWLNYCGYYWDPSWYLFPQNPTHAISQANH